MDDYVTHTHRHKFRMWGKTRVQTSKRPINSLGKCPFNSLGKCNFAGDAKRLRGLDGLNLEVSSEVQLLASNCCMLEGSSGNL